ncbi:MAG: dienelactone hydrolase family protein [Acidobacteriota bacterium]|nr:dienelactone hydrolase family protein [Acidobacteriota bacterium]
MRRILNLPAVPFGLAVLALFFSAMSGRAAARSTQFAPRQDTGFLNRSITMHGVAYRFQVYLPQEWRRDEHRRWPIILFLHGMGERGSEGMWQTEIGLPEAVRDHPERWPFIIVLPQCPQMYYWTDPPMIAMAMAELDKESKEFNADPERTYLTGLSLGGYGAWELGKVYPKRWAAIAIASGGIFWSYAPQRWQQSGVLPQEYARAIGKTPIWLFHGSNDPVVPPRESELMYAAFKADGGHIRLWIYQGLKHDSWSRAFNEPDLPRWLLEHRLGEEVTPYAERAVIPLHPQAIPLNNEQLDALSGEYRDIRGLLALTVYHQGETLYRKDRHGFVAELAAESPNALFYPKGDSISRLLVERDRQGRITALIVHDDRSEERLERIRSSVRNLSQ